MKFNQKQRQLFDYFCWFASVVIAFENRYTFLRVIKPAVHPFILVGAFSGLL